MKRLLQNLALAAGSFLLVLLIALAADRLAGPPRPNDYAGKRLSLLFAPGAVEHFEASEFRFTASINDLGLRDGPVTPGPTDRYRIVVVGDSFTYGWGVNIEDTWVKRLEAELRAKGYDVELVNAGRSGEGSASYVDMVARLLPVLQPDLVLLGMLHNDMGISHAERVGLGQPLWLHALGLALPNTLARVRYQRIEAELQKVAPQAPPELSTERNRELSQGAAENQAARMTPEQRAKLDALEPEIREQFFAGRVNPFMVSVGVTAPQFYTSLTSLEGAYYMEIMWRVAGHLKAIKENAASYGAPTIAAIVPAGVYTNVAQNKSVARMGFETSPDMLKSDVPDQLTQQACAVNNMVYLSVTEVFRQHADDPTLYFPLDNHFSVAGHALYAKSIAPLLEFHLKNAPRISQ